LFSVKDLVGAQGSTHKRGTAVRLSSLRAGEWAHRGGGHASGQILTSLFYSNENVITELSVTV
jgi:hypothetical protein